MIPAVIGKYRVLEVLGRGAMGEVYLGVDPLLGRRVAIKVMRGASAELAERFLHEARIVASLSHPNIVGLLEFGFEAGEPFFAMEYLAGESLDAWRQRARPLPEVLGVVEGLLSALAHAHANGVLHRDVKPSNIQVMPDGSAKLMDFGVAHTDAARLTATGAVMGTPAYMAPELVAGEPCSVRTDIYAAGVVLYELLAGRNPFEGPSMAAVLSKVLHSTPLPIQEVRPGLPAELGELVSSCTARDPERRPASVAAVLSAVQRLRGVVEGRAADVPETVVLGTAARETAVPAPESRPPAPTARPKPGPRQAMAGRLALGLLAALVGLGAWSLLGRAPVPTTAVPPPTTSTAPTTTPAAEPTPARASEEPGPSEPPRPAPTRPAPSPRREPVTAPAVTEPSVPAPQASPRPDPVPASTPVATPWPAVPATPLPTLIAPVPEAQGPRLESLTPGSLRRGASGRLEIRGTGFRPGLRVTVLHGRRPAIGIVVSGQRLLDAGLISCTVSVDSDVPLDAYAVVLLDPEGASSNGLTLEVTL